MISLEKFACFSFKNLSQIGIYEKAMKIYVIMEKSISVFQCFTEQANSRLE